MAHPREILNQLGANPRKSLSQNFLTSPHWVEKLTTPVIEAEPCREIWEIGPGLGALTARLAEKSPVPVRLFEYDKKLSEYLRKLYPKLTLIEGDVLKAPLESLAIQAGTVNILSNLPYHLSSPVFFKLVELKAYLNIAVMTFQKEFAERLSDKVGDENYGALSVVAGLHFKMESLGVLPPGAFFPAPSIASEALKLTPILETNIDASAVTKTVKAAFLHPRKKMLSNLKSVFPNIEWGQALETMVLSTNTRAEELTREQFLQLAAIAFPPINQ